jgi:hypothetical protein
MTTRDTFHLIRPGLLLLGLCCSINAQQPGQLAAQQETREQTNANSVARYAAAKNDPVVDSGESPPYDALSLSSHSSPHPAPVLIIRNLIDVESKFRETLLQFSFKRDVVLQTIGQGGEVTGEYIRNSSFVLDDRGKRIERVLYHPKSTIREMTITKEDLQDLAGSQLFGLDLDQLDAYDFSDFGEEYLNERAVFVVAVNPKQEPDPHHMRTRFFVGRIWIDAESFQIVKLEGITKPHGKQRFPAFQTKRDLKIESLLFPSTTSADDVLHFTHKDVRYRIDVRYYDFKRFASRVKIVEIE